MARKRYTYDYPRPSVCVDMAIFTLLENRFRVLLIRRGDEPFKGQWALPGGFVDIDEDLEAAARRELGEETGVKAATLRQFGAFGAPGRDPRGRTISVGYFALVNHDRVLPRAGDDAAEVGWFSVRRPPPLAFDHRLLLRTAMKTVQAHIEDPRTLRPLLPRTFSMRTLRQTCESVLGKSLDPRAFARLVRAEGCIKSVGRGLYRF